MRWQLPPEVVWVIQNTGRNGGLILPIQSWYWTVDAGGIVEANGQQKGQRDYQSARESGHSSFANWLDELDEVEELDSGLVQGPKVLEARRQAPSQPYQDVRRRGPWGLLL